MKRLWFADYSLKDVTDRGQKTLVTHLGIEFTELGSDYLVGTMPVDERTKQPIGLLHGGASVALAETLMSMAGNMVVDRSKQFCVGLEINANHLRSATGGKVTGTARAIHIGKTTQVWETRIEQEGKTTCISRMTLSVLDKR